DVSPGLSRLHASAPPKPVTATGCDYRRVFTGHLVHRCKPDEIKRKAVLRQQRGCGKCQAMDREVESLAGGKFDRTGGRPVVRGLGVENRTVGGSSIVMKGLVEAHLVDTGAIDRGISGK